jgi:glycosyltransferase involved in cell wall biosynthesis
VEAVQDGVTGVCLPPRLPVSDYARLGGGRDRMPALVYDPQADRLAAPQLVDPAAVAEAVRGLCSDAARYARMSEAARGRARERFDFRRYCHERDGLIVEAIRRRRAGG